METISKTEIEMRIGRLQGLLRSKDIGAALIVQRVDLVYYSGTGQNAHLVVPAEGKPTLMVKKSYDRAKQESPLENVVPLKSFKDLAGYLAGDFAVGMELDVLPVSLFERYRSILPGRDIVDLSGLIRQARAVKSEFEIAQLRQAAKIMDSVMLSLPGILKQGISEVALCGALEAVARAGGSQGRVRMRAFNQEMYFAHVFSGPNAAVPSFFDGPTGGLGLGAAFPQGPSTDPIVPGAPIVLDITIPYNGYIVDQTRIASLGTLDPFFRDAYHTALEIQELLISQAKPGVLAEELYENALACARQAGLEQHFMGFGADRAAFIGHGVGLELDELPVLAKGMKVPLEAGMVVALEPKFVFPGKGVIGIENTFVVTGNGLERISYSNEEIVEVKSQIIQGRT